MWRRNRLHGERACVRRGRRTGERCWRGEARGMQELEATPPLWRATVPVFLAVLERMEAELAQAEARPRRGNGGGACAAALAGDDAGGAAGGDGGAAYPAHRLPARRRTGAGVCVNRWTGRGSGRGWRRRGSIWPGLDPAAFAGAEGRTVTAQAGFAHAGAAGRGLFARVRPAQPYSTTPWRMWR